ncbi:hypothetical protein H4219_000226 [Mycoemilia scoparia]|uniref:AN1-type domain-containing protein n=1 Tax=Mycoemilia scoparia TaxID=417184 RepID=A0A9W8DXE9_9FUNG|nr:hypothetical protein H4219_000226 [Mycoemilia scoparia]
MCSQCYRETNKGLDKGKSHLILLHSRAKSCNLGGQPTGVDASSLALAKEQAERVSEKTGLKTASLPVAPPSVVAQAAATEVEPEVTLSSPKAPSTPTSQTQTKTSAPASPKATPSKDKCWHPNCRTTVRRTHKMITKCQCGAFYCLTHKASTVTHNCEFNRQRGEAILKKNNQNSGRNVPSGGRSFTRLD